MTSRPSWDATWMDVASVVAKRSKCDGRAIGAVIVDAKNRIVSTGYNGAPAGLTPPLAPDSTCRSWCPRMQSGAQTLDYTNCVSVHAETNALAFADRRSYEGGTIYVTSAICWDCGKLVANSGVSRVVVQVWRADRHRDPERTIGFIEACGLSVSVWRPEG